jgi:hypothetical protein
MSPNTRSKALCMAESDTCYTTEYTECLTTVVIAVVCGPCLMTNLETVTLSHEDASLRLELPIQGLGIFKLSENTRINEVRVIHR